MGMFRSLDAKDEFSSIPAQTAQTKPVYVSIPAVYLPRHRLELESVRASELESVPGLELESAPEMVLWGEAVTIT